MATSFVTSTQVKMHQSAPKVAYSINCSLCGCNGASVRCEKCNSMAFCIGCDDMYHRHPKRRNHLRQAVALEFLHALEKHQHQQQVQADARNLKSPLGFLPKQDNQNLYPWRRPRTLPRMPDNFPTTPTPTPVAPTAPVPMNTAAPVASWAQHPSKMPVPPPRRKKKLSFSGLKDTFRKFVNPNHYKNQQSPEPIYATIQKPIVTINNGRPMGQTNGKQMNGSVPSAFRPLPALPPNEPDAQIYENTRKHSLPAFDSQTTKKKIFASTFDLREYENFVRSNGCDPADINLPPEARSSTLPRKNLSCLDISRNATLTNQPIPSPTQPQMAGQLWNNCANCSAQAQHQATHGSTQSLYPGFFPGGNHPHAQLFSPNMFAGCQATGCASCNHFTAHHWGCSQSVANVALGQCNRCPNGHSLTNSMEELHGRHARGFDDYEDDLSEDEENDDEPRRMKKNRRKASSASTASHIRRTQSSYSMYPNLENSHVHGSHCPSPNPYPNYPNQSSGHSGHIQSLRSHNTSPSPSVKSYTGARPMDRYPKSSDNMSDSSSSQDALLNSPKRPEYPGILTNGNRKLSTSSSASSSRFRELPQEVMQRSQLQQEAQTVYQVEEPEIIDELVNDAGQWSCRFCTFFNDVEKNICDICCKTRANPQIVVQSPKSILSISNAMNYSKQSPTSVPSMSSIANANLSPSKPNQASPSIKRPTENEFIFDEKLIREQLEIERELARRRENERRIEEENKRLAELSEEQKNREAELKKAESIKSSKLQVKQVTAPETPSQSKASPEPIDHEQIVARIIEEKISEKLSTLKLNSGSTTSLNRIESTNQEKSDDLSLKLVSESSTVVAPPEPLISLKKEELISHQIIKTPNVPATSQPQLPFQPPLPTQPQVQLQQQIQPQSSIPYQQPEYSFSNNSYQPQPDFSNSQQNLPNSYPNFQQQNSQQFPFGPNSSTQSYPHQQNGYQQQQQLNQTPHATPAYPSATPVPYQSQYGSNQYLNQFAMQPQPSQPLIGGIGGGFSQQNSSQPSHPLYQRHQSFSSESNSSIMSKPMNRFSSFDDLQSMSSVTSAGSLYGRQDSQKGHMESGLHIIQTLRDAEKKGYTADDVEVAIQFSPNAPLDWLDDNWPSMCETVLTMANNQIIELERALTGKKPASFKPGLNLVTGKDARLALRICKGNIWQAVEKCIQRYQDNKAGFSTPLSGDLKSANGKMSGAIPKSSKSFSLKVSGQGNGKANNDAYDPGMVDQEEMYDEVFDVRSDVAEEEVENSMNPEFLFKEAPDQTPMEVFISSKDSSETNELLDFYIRKLNQADSAAGQPQFDRDQMEALIYNWRYEKMVMEAGREQMKRAEKEKRKLQKMLDLQRRIGGYLSDGTTTEEELDREVEQVFASHEELRAKLAGIEGDDDDSSDTTTHLADVFPGPGPSGMASSDSNSSTITLQEEEDEDVDDRFDEIEQRIQAKLNSLLETSQQNQQEVQSVTLIDVSLSSKAIATKPSVAKVATQPKAQSAVIATANATEPQPAASTRLLVNVVKSSATTENVQQILPNQAVSAVNRTQLTQSISNAFIAIEDESETAVQPNQIASQIVSKQLTANVTISAPEPVLINSTQLTNAVVANATQSVAVQGNAASVSTAIDLYANVTSSTVSTGAIATDKQQEHSFATLNSTPIESVAIHETKTVSQQVTSLQNIPRNDAIELASGVVVQNDTSSASSVAIDLPSIEPQTSQVTSAESSETASVEKKKVKKIKVKKVKPKTDSNVVVQPKLLQPQNASSDSLSSIELMTVIERPKETTNVAPEPSSEAVSATDRINQSFSDATQSIDHFDEACSTLAASLPVPQAPVFSKLKGSDQRRTAHLRKSAPNLLRIMSASSENIAANQYSPMDTFGEFKQKLKSGTFQFADWRQTQPVSRSPRKNLFKSKSIDFDHAQMGDSSISHLRRQRARNVIVHKLKSLESLPSLSTQNLLEPFSAATMQSHSNSSLATSASTSNQSSNEKHVDVTDENTDSNALHYQNRRDDFEILAAEAQENPPQDVRWSRLDYGVDFEWARTEFECELCTSMVPVQDIVSLISCTHFACHECLRQYFTVQIRERQRLVITCPFCEEPAIGADEDEKVFDYLGLFDPFVRHIVDADVYELFQRKLRDRALMRDPNFMWCTQCSSGFISPNPMALTVMCPDCRNLTCQKCKKPWKKQHFNISCDAYAQWEMSNDPQFAEQQLNKHLKEFGIECPNCKFRYQLAKGGCMHFRCIQCSYDFCGGCSRPFKLGNRCFRARMCAALGLHAHHPRNCLFYLRDKDITELKKLLDQHKIEYRTELEGDQEVTRCKVMEQKETDSGMKDEPCNRFVESAGLCKLHYKEYLGNLIYQNKVDPITILTEVELELVLRRENIRIPNQKIRNITSGNSSNAKDDEEYRKKLIELIMDKVPLDLWE